MSDFKESVTSDGMYHVSKKAQDYTYSLSISNDEVDDGLKQAMRDTINGQIEMAKPKGANK